MIPRRDLVFQLIEVLRLEELLQRPQFAVHDRATIGAIIDAAYELAEEKFAPCAAQLDREEPRIENGRVLLPQLTADALRAYGDASFGALAFPQEFGGMGLPVLLNQACGAVFASANVSLFSYAMLSQGAANLIASFGNEPQRRRYLAPMLAGQWFGTMCLSEAQAGSSLADIRTTATPLGEGRFAIRGQKMWISGGEHELGANIVHLVLARIPGSPAGVKGISLFIVPRRRVGSSGEPAADNGVALIGLNRGTMNSEMPLTPAGPPGTRASTR